MNYAVQTGPPGVTRLSATELARRIREGQLSPVEVVEAHIQRIEAVNLHLNALVTPLFDLARRTARAAEAAVERGEQLGPLHGVPFTIKDSFDMAGVRSTCGLTSRSLHFPAQDATLVARLRAAGAIPLGKTNVPDNYWSQETENLLFGRTNNPWNTARTVGGSSGGEAAIIAAGGSPLGIGSDIAGSIRLPAHFTGIVGLRPTSAALSEAGHWPPAIGRLADLAAAGPMARHVADVALAYDVLRGVTPAPLDSAALQSERVAFWFDDGLIPCSNAVRGAVHTAVAALREAGMYPVEGAPALRRFSVTGWAAYQHDVERMAIAAGFGNGEPWSPLGELGRALRGRARVGSSALLYWLASHSGSLLAETVGIDGARWREELRAQMADLIGPGGVAVCPVFPTSAPRHGWTWRTLAPLTNINYLAWVNLAGLPGLTVPVGRSGNGLPVAVQIVGAPNSERTLLAAGLVVERFVQQAASM